MAHNVIPILSASPPPMDGFDEWGDDDEFGGFEAAPCQKLPISSKSEITKVKVEETNGHPANQNPPREDSIGVVKPEVHPVVEVTSRINGVTINEVNVETPSHESVVDSGWGSDGSPLAKSEEFADFSAGLTVGDDDMTSVTAMSREDSASSSLAGEFKRSGSELVLPDISNPVVGDESDDDTGLNMTVGVEFPNPDPPEEDWGAFSDSVHGSSPEEETSKQFPETGDSAEPNTETDCTEQYNETSESTEVCNETSPDAEMAGDICDKLSDSSHIQNVEVNKNESKNDFCADSEDVLKTLDGAADMSAASDPLDDTVTSECRRHDDVDGDDRFANIRDDEVRLSVSGDDSTGAPGHEGHVSVQKTADKVDVGSTDQATVDKWKMNESNTDSDIVADEVTTGEKVTDDQMSTGDAVVAGDAAVADDWDPFADDIADVAPVADDAWSAFAATDKVVTPDETANDWAAFAQPSFSNVTTNDRSTENAETETETHEAGAETAENDFGDFNEPQSKKNAGSEDDEFGDFEEGDFGEFEESEPAAEMAAPAVISEQSKHDTLAKLTELVASCFSDPETEQRARDHDTFLENTLEEILEKPKYEVVEKTTEENGTSQSEVDKNVWNRLVDLDRTPPCMKVTYRDSEIFQQVLKVLDIDPRNILNAKKPAVPVFASSLGLLEPSKPGAEPKPEPLASATSAPSAGSIEQGETNIPPVEFDWSGAGLTNPLDSTQSGSSFDLDFFIDTTNKPTVQTKSTALENEFLSPIDLPTKKKALTLDSILGNAIFTSVKKDKNENISSEASKVLEKLPNLSFMKAKVLMFPIRSSGTTD